MPNKNKLSIYMIKDEFQDDAEIIKGYSDVFEDAAGTIYLGASFAKEPDWVESFFTGRINSDRLFTANARAVLLVKDTY